MLAAFTIFLMLFKDNVFFKHKETTSEKNNFLPNNLSSHSYASCLRKISRTTPLPYYRASCFQYHSLLTRKSSYKIRKVSPRSQDIILRIKNFEVCKSK